jgi:hypothetical protein
MPKIAYVCCTSSDRRCKVEGPACDPNTDLALPGQDYANMSAVLAEACTAMEPGPHAVWHTSCNLETVRSMMRGLEICEDNPSAGK